MLWQIDYFRFVFQLQQRQRHLHVLQHALCFEDFCCVCVQSGFRRVVVLEIQGRFRLFNTDVIGFMVCLEFGIMFQDDRPHRCHYYTCGICHLQTSTGDAAGGL